MFEAAVTKFVKSVGEESLIAVPNLDQADNCRPLHIIVKKNRRWFWQRAKYEPSPFQLHDLLTRPEPVLVEQITRKLCTYNKKHKFSIDGRIGAKLKTFLDAEIAGSDSVDVNVAIGDVNKIEVDQQDLMDKLEKRYIDLSHEFIKQVTLHGRKVLCVIVGAAYPVNNCLLSASTQASGEETLDVHKVAEFTEHGSIHHDKQNQFTIPKNTPLAFNVCELSVGQSGQMTLMVDPDSPGRFNTEDETDSEPEDDDNFYEMVYKGIHQLPDHERRDYAIHVQNMCAHPKDIDALYDVLKSGIGTSEAGIDKSVNLSGFKGQFEGSPDDYMSILTQCGFQEQDDSMVYPTEPSPVLLASMCVTEALIQLDDDETIAFRSLNKNLAKQLMHLLEEASEGKPMKISDPELVPLYEGSNTGQAFLNEMGFQVSSDGTLLPPTGDRSELEGGFRVIHALWGEMDDESDRPKSNKSCNIL